MKYSLRSLLIVVTLVAVLLGGRVEYLRRWEAFHQREAERYAEQICREQNISRSELEMLLSLATEGDFSPSPELPTIVSIVTKDREFGFRLDHLNSLNEHRQQAANYRQALRWPGK
jgi:hypothetical protein